jgi:multidrug efflux pump subunit AcrA (membrane-fusion protein)
VHVQIPALGESAKPVRPTRIELLPTVDATTLTQTVRIDLPTDLGAMLAPGQFARVRFDAAPAKAGTAATAAAAGTLAVPAAAVVRRSELTAVYVLDDKGKPMLRQVRLGQPLAEGDIEVLAGLDAGERVVTEPAKALRP